MKTHYTLMSAADREMTTQLVRQIAQTVISMVDMATEGK